MSDTYKPAAVRFLAAVVERHCAVHGIVRDADREIVAARAIRVYSQGIHDEEAMLKALHAMPTIATEKKASPTSNGEPISRGVVLGG